MKWSFLVVMMLTFVLTNSVSLSYQSYQTGLCPNNQVLLPSFNCGCDAHKFMFLNSTFFCVHCPPPGAWFAPNLTCLICASTLVANASNGNCICPASHPHLAPNLKCVRCPHPQYWNQTASQCQSCPPHQHWNETTQYCQPCSAGGFVLNPATSKCQCPPGSYNDTTNGTCVQCLPPQFWNAGQNQCQCPPSLPYYFNGNCYICPQYSPVWNGIQCLSCPTGHHYNPTCQCCCLCLPGLYYNSTLNGCVL